MFVMSEIIHHYQEWYHQRYVVGLFIIAMYHAPVSTSVFVGYLLYMEIKK